jgi:hypothetical protein
MKIKKTCYKKAKTWKRKGPNVGLSPFSLPELRKNYCKKAELLGLAHS